MLCSEGFFIEFIGATSCKPCTRGYFSNMKGATTCTVCSLGRYGDTFAATSPLCSGFCQSIPGTYCSIGATSLNGNACGVGYFSSSYGLNFKSSCIPCAVGTFSVQSISSRCYLSTLGI